MLAVRCDIAGPIVTKQRKNERKQSNGYSLDLLCVGRKQRDPGPGAGPGAFAGAVFVGSETAGANVPEYWRGWRPGGGISLVIYSDERKDAKVAATVLELAGRSTLISLILSVAEADVATGVDDKICTQSEVVKTCCRLITRRELALSKPL
ncbi:hypothetical protein B296_00023850 [Ensete ventricosum]|uniref:Uncharacterized protein n=1 Tax=Ensete ventricosum TaxID=4639 RepID=A0A427AGQ7_ENSVE|nr:hypothetical protein B296_00023850 [Ensete ventricosum]